MTLGLINYKAELNPQQYEVVMKKDDPVLVIAGAGSGKTRTLVYKVARLIETGVDPSSIMLVTFTKKAANEMIGRVETLIKQDVKKLLAGTFHHAGHIFLRRHAKVLGLSENFTIIDREDAASLMGEVRKDFLGSEDAFFPGKEVLIQIYSLTINTCTKLPDLLMLRFEYLTNYCQDMRKIFQEYEKRKAKLNVVDFDDLLVNWKRLIFEHAHIKDYYNQRIHYILVDEYQDTNKLQARIIEHMAKPRCNITVVGDDAQSIYAFRGANISNILDFPKRFPDCHIFKLEINYRSIPPILRFANSSISHNSRQFEKVLRPVRKGNLKPEVYYALDPADQADFVASKTDEFIKSGVKPSEIAVLYRNHVHSMELQMGLTRMGISFEVRSGLKFFEQAHVKDVMAYLKIITNPKDQIAWARILKIYEGIGEKTTQKIIKALPNIDYDLLKLNSKELCQIIPSSAKQSWNNLSRLLLKINTTTIKRSCHQAINIIMSEFYERYLKGRYPNAIERIEDIRRVGEYARDFGSIEQFLADMTLLTNVPGEEVRAQKDRVILSTVHQAKGLEWDVVFIIWLIEKQFPYSRSISKGEMAIEEERRLFYVGCTRARNRLILVCPSYYRGWYEEAPSRFIKEVETAYYRQL